MSEKWNVQKISVSILQTGNKLKWLIGNQLKKYGSINLSDISKYWLISREILSIRIRSFEMFIARNNLQCFIIWKNFLKVSRH